MLKFGEKIKKGWNMLWNGATQWPGFNPNYFRRRSAPNQLKRDGVIFFICYKWHLWCFSKKLWYFSACIFSYLIQYLTRATFETPKYPRRSRNQYMSPSSKYINTLELSPYRSPMSLEAWLSSLSLVLWWLFSWYRLFAMCICTNIQDSVAFPVMLPIDIEDAHHYWNIVYR